MYSTCVQLYKNGLWSVSQILRLSQLQNINSNVEERKIESSNPLALWLSAFCRKNPNIIISYGPSIRLIHTPMSHEKYLVFCNQKEPEAAGRNPSILRSLHVPFGQESPSVLRHASLKFITTFVAIFTVTWANGFISYLESNQINGFLSWALQHKFP